MLSHLKNNVVGYAALVIALAGTSYAAGLAPNSVGTAQLKKNAVVTAKIKKDAVTGAKVKNGSLGAKDLKAGVLKAEYAAADNFGGNLPSATPDNGLGDLYPITLPRAGAVLVDYFSDGRGITCSAGTGRIGLYLDGAPIDDTAMAIGSFNTTLTDVNPRAVVPMTAGSHTLSTGMDCPGGDASIAIQGTSANWTITLLN